MLRKLILLILATELLSCSEPQTIEEDTLLEHQTEVILHNIKEGDMEILFIDECEYIVFKDGMGTNHGFGYMAHKGNCKNPIHIYNKSKESD